MPTGGGGVCNSAFTVVSRLKGILSVFHEMHERHEMVRVSQGDRGDQRGTAQSLQPHRDELEFRFNNRKNRRLFRDTITRLCEGKTLPYDKLTA